MNPTSSFLSKCTTVLIGVALCWITMTNRDAQLLANRLFGPRQVSSVHDTPNSASPQNGAFQPRDQAANQATNQATEDEQITEISQMLKDLGATYLRVEKLANAGETWFRVRCDLDRGPNQVKCCLESTRDSAVAALRDVLRAAEPET